MSKEWLPDYLMEDSVGYTYHLDYEDEEDRNLTPLIVYEYSEGMEEPTVHCLIGTGFPEIHGLLVQPTDIESATDQELGALIRRAYGATSDLAYYKFFADFFANPFQGGRHSLTSQSRFQEMFAAEYQRANELAVEHEEWRTLFALLRTFWECENPEAGYIYCLDDQQGHFKLGRTKQLNTRIKQLGTQPPFEIVLRFAFKVPHMRAYESHLHKEFQHKRLRGEWFKLDEEDLKHIQRFAWLPEEE